MTNKTGETLKTDHLSALDWGRRFVFALLFAATGSLIILVFSPLRPVLDPVPDFLGRIGLSVLLLVVALLLRRNSRFEKYWQVMFGLFILAVAVSLDWILSIYLLDYLQVDSSTPAGFALLKLNEFAVVWIVVPLLTRRSGSSLGSIYIQKGKLKLGLSIGLAAFCIAAAGSVPMATLLFQGTNLTLTRIAPWIPWLLLFVLANAAMEELLFRGLFLRKLEPFYGRFLSNFLIVFVFTLLHKGVTYSTNEYFFVAILVLLGLVWGAITQKTDSLWGAILFHAGTDIPVALGIFSNLT